MAFFNFLTRGGQDAELKAAQAEIRALEAENALAAQNEIMLKSSVASEVMVGHNVGRAAWTPADYEKLAKEGYENCATAFRCISLLAKSGAIVKPRVKNKGSKDYIDEHPILDLLHKPTPRWGMQEMFEAMYAFLLMQGNTYLEAVGPSDPSKPPKELWNQRPDRMKIVPGNKGLPLRFEYKKGTQRVSWAVNQVTGYSQIMHHKEFHPTDDWYGMSRLQAASWAVDRHNAMSEHNTALLQNGARPSGALVMKPVKGPNQSEKLAPKEIIQKAEDALQSRNAGPRQAGKPMVLGGNVDWVDMALSPKDMDWASGKEDAMLEICNAFGVPYILLMRGESSYNNLTEAKLDVWENNLIPLIDGIYDMLNSWLSPRYSDKLLLCPNYDDVPALEERRKIKRAAVLELFDKGLISDVEAREELGYGDREENDVDKIDHNIIRVLLEASQTLGLEPLIRYMKSVHLIDATMTEAEIVKRALALMQDDDEDDDQDADGQGGDEEADTSGNGNEEDSGTNVRSIGTQRRRRSA